VVRRRPGRRQPADGTLRSSAKRLVSATVPCVCLDVGFISESGAGLRQDPVHQGVGPCHGHARPSARRRRLPRRPPAAGQVAATGLPQASHGRCRAIQAPLLVFHSW
jgi:hypothetical protein